MNFETACKILDITISGDEENNVLNLEELKRKYKLSALMYHPDKNNSAEAVGKFQEISNAYEYLLKYEGFTDESDDEYEADDVHYESFSCKNKYSKLLFSFLKNILCKDNANKLLYTIFCKFATACETTILENLEKVEKKTLSYIVEIVKKYRNVLHISPDFVNKIENILTEKQLHENIIVINPLIDDLLENNLYKMTVAGDTVIVIPLWHHEMVFDTSKGDVCVKCSPILPDNICLDEENNIHVSCEYFLLSIWEKKVINVSIGKYTYPVDLSVLKLLDEQTVIYMNQGIAKINTKDMYDVSRKSDVYIHITLHV
jgi:hypothetical protein